MLRIPIQLIHFHYLTDRFHFPNRQKLKAFIYKLFQKEGYAIDHLNYIFCSDADLLKLNKQYLKHNDYTDIITFPYSKPGEPVLSDVYISISRVRENARKFKSGFTHELHRVMFHGALHLCGYKDKTFKDIHEIRAREALYLNKYFVSRET